MKQEMNEVKVTSTTSMTAMETPSTTTSMTAMDTPSMTAMETFPSSSQRLRQYPPRSSSIHDYIDDIPTDHIHIDSYKPTRTREEIETEFHHLEFLHRHDISFNTSTIFNDTHLNGSFNHNILIRSVDDTYIAFSTDIAIVHNLAEFWSIYDTHVDTHNVLIDSRLIEYIAYATIKYGDNILIYDTYTGHVNSIYFFCSQHYHIQTNELSINQIKQLFIMHLIVLVYAKDIQIRWSISDIIKMIKLNDHRIHFDHNASVSTIDVLINYMQIQSQTQITRDNVLRVVKLFDHAFSPTAYTSTTSNEIKPWQLEDVSNYEFFVALTVLKNNDFRLLLV